VVKITLPKKGTILEFNNFKRSTKVPIVIYADFECMTKRIQSCQPDLDKSFTEKYQKHEPSGFCYYILKNGEPVKEFLYSQREDGEDIAGIFIDRLEKDLDRIWSLEKRSCKLMVMNEKDKIDFENAKTCYLCKKQHSFLMIKSVEIMIIKLENIVGLPIINVIYFIKSHNTYQ